MTTQHLTPNQRCVVDLLRKAGPMTSAEVAQRLQRKHSPTVDNLREARKAGAAARTGAGTFVLWHIPEHKDQAAALLAQRKQAITEARRVRQRRTQTFAVKRLRAERDAERWADALPVQRRVAANDAPPIEVLGPVSVFALAQSLRSLCAA